MAIDLAADPARVAEVRHAVAGALRAWRLTAVAEDLALIASELVGNAVRFACPRGVAVLLKATGEAVVLEVADSEEEQPRKRRAGDGEESGRGLLLVEALSDAWGFRPRGGGGKVVWARVDLPAVRPGIWCELLAADARGAWLVGSFDAPSPQAAEGWIRISAHAYLAALKPLNAADLDAWTEAIEHDARPTLSRGGAYECRIDYGGATVVWTARPVRLLPVAGRRHLPPCAHMFPPFDRPRPGGGA